MKAHPTKTRSTSSSGAAKRAALAATAGNGAGPKQDHDPDEGEPFVVGIGASAGGLQALESFFGSLKDTPHAAFVVVQHLSPDFKSFMVELLAKHTNMPVQRAEQQMKVKAGNVYLIPPRTTLTIVKGQLHLEKYDPHHGLHLPIDRFFLSLAQDQQYRAVGVVLSGTGSDGTAGIRAIKDAGGMVMVQSEESAQFDGMPRSAIGTGLADYVLPPESMPAQLSAYLSHPLLTSKRGFDPRRDGEAALSEIFSLLRTHSGVDFANYKPATVDRRVERRMSVCQIDNLADYVRHLRQSTREVALLFNELLIGVTSFLRDRPAWEALQKEVLPELLRDLPVNEAFRAWVPGCSTGEEAYSLAIVVIETMDKLRLHHAVKIFATDISKDALAIATHGHYSPSEVAGLPTAWLNKYFVKEDVTYRVTQRLREMVVFANHNLLGDPPFTKLRLISCRNLLIYLQPPLQQRIFALFSFALLDKGALFLGASESVGDASDRFRSESSRANIFRNRRTGVPPPALNLTVVGGVPVGRSTPRTPANPSASVFDMPSLDDVHKHILGALTPPCLAVDVRNDVIHVVGDAGRFLRQPAGPFTRNLFKLTSHNLANALRSALVAAHKKGDRITVDNVRYSEGRKHFAARIDVFPLPDKNGKRSGVRIVMIYPKLTTAPAKKARTAKVERVQVEQIEALELELAQTRESLQATVQELETSNEEIQASNEELLAANEELQSTNEELQSVNEELHTVNTENQNRIEELTRLTNDINNLLSTSAVAVLLVDAQLRVRRASRFALTLLDMNEGDLGMPIETVARLLDAADLPAMAGRVIRTGQGEEREIERVILRRWFLVRCVPYRNELGQSEGVVISIVDLTERHLVDQRLLGQAALTQSVLDAMDAAVALLDADGRIVHVNEGWGALAAALGAAEPQRLAVGANYFDICDTLHPPRDGMTQRCTEGLRSLLRGEARRFVTEYRGSGAQHHRQFRMHAVPLTHASQAALAVAHFELTGGGTIGTPVVHEAAAASLDSPPPQVPQKT